MGFDFYDSFSLQTVDGLQLDEYLDEEM